MSRPHPLVQLTLMRVREFTREPEAVFWAVFFPILLAVGLGIAFAGRPEAVLKVAAASPAIARAFERRARPRRHRAAPMRRAWPCATARSRLVAEPGDGRRGRRIATTTRIPKARTARMLADAAVQRAAGRVDPVTATDTIARDPGSRYIDFLIPGLVGIGIMSNAVWGLGFSIVDTRRRKLTKRLMATPMSRVHYLMSYLIWRLIVLAVEVVIPIAFGALAFGVPIRGTLDHPRARVLGSLTFSAIGLLVASRARTIEAVSGLTNLVVMPMWIVSGVFFSAQRFPDLVQPLIRVLPLTAFIDAMRGILLQGASLSEFPRELVTLGLWLAVCFTVALKIFRWR